MRSDIYLFVLINSNFHVLYDFFIQYAIDWFSVRGMECVCVKYDSSKVGLYSYVNPKKTNVLNLFWHVC